MNPEIIILTFAVGGDYKRDLEQCFKSKETYAAKHNYKYIQGGNEWWDRSRPIAWSKIPFLLSELRKNCDKNCVIWLSDADVLLTNMELSIESHILPVFPANKSLLWCRDSCGNWNSGNIFIRPNAWSINFFERVWNYTEALYHIWWENKAMIDLLSASDAVADRQQTVFLTDNRRFNSYIQCCETVDGQKQGVWQPGDFLVHFAGIYDSKKIGQYSLMILNSHNIKPIAIHPAKKDEYAAIFLLSN
jgi:hypothetical protein